VSMLRPRRLTEHTCTVGEPPEARGTLAAILRQVRPVICAVLALVSCNEPSSQDATGLPPTACTILDRSDDNTEVALAVGKEVELRLDGQMSTGYMWEITAIDSAVLRCVSWSYQDTTQRHGGTGTFSFTLRAVATGRTVLRLDYRRPWETQVPAIDSFRVTILVI